MRKRSKYRPRPVLQNPLDFVLSGMQPLSRLKDQFLMMQIKHREALEQVRTGNATKDHVNNHPYCLHLWRPAGQDVLRPDRIMVGYK